MTDMRLFEGPRRRRPTIVTFVSSVPHSGRTSVVANLAWALASDGHDVLILDWDPRGPAVHEYLRRFWIDEGELADFLGSELAQGLRTAMAAGSAATDPAPRWTFRRYTGTGVKATGRLDVVKQEASLTPGVLDDSAREAFAELRSLLAAGDYEYVFVDGPPPARGATAGRDGVLADQVVLCFRPGQRAVESAARIAVEIARESPVGNRIIAVPGFFDDSDPIRARDQKEEMRSELLRALRAAGSRLQPESVELVPIPLHPGQQVLVALAYAQPSLLEAFRQLLASLTGGEVDSLPAVSAVLQRWYGRRLASTADLDEPVIEIRYRSPERPWADWTRAQLASVPLPATLRCVDDLAADWLTAESLVLCEPSADTTQQPADGIVLRVAETLTPRPSDEGQAVNLYGCSPAQARGRLLAAVAGSDEPGMRAGPGGNLPSGSAAHAAVPEPDSDVVHRGREMEALRDALPPSTAGRVLVCGDRATGKTELAKAFAHTFGYDYDTVWFVPAHSRHAVRSSLTELAEAIGADPTGDSAAAALRQLADDPGRYLLIYDDMADPGQLADLIPSPGSGHVIITQAAASAPVEPGVTVVTLGPLTPAEATETLAIQLPDVQPAELDRLVREVGTGPLLIRLLAGCLRIATEALQNGGQTPADAALATVDGFLSALTPSEAPRQLTDVGRFLIELLEATDPGRVLATMARMCALLSPQGVALRLLRSTPMLDRLIDLAGPAAAALADDTIEFERALTVGARAALFKIDWQTRPRLRMHRGVQDMLKALMAGTQLDEVQAATMAGLAACAPSDAAVFAGDGQEVLLELGLHLASSGALEQTASRAVRRWVVVHLGSVAARRDRDECAEAAAIAEKVRVRWASLPPDSLNSRLATHHADLIRVLGDDAKAFALDLETLDEQERLLGSAHPRTSFTRRGAAGDLRGLGNFMEALAEDRAIYRAIRAALGAEHPQTMRALHNLALSNYLAGLQQLAEEREAEVYAGRMRLLGPDDYSTWWSLSELGIFRRELGRLDDAVASIERAHRELVRLLREGHLLTLRATVALGVTQRRVGARARARSLLSKAVNLYRQNYGDRNRETQSARLSLAVSLAHRGGDLAEAVEVATEALDVFATDLQPDHPFVALCRLNLAALLRQDGRLGPAEEMAAGAVPILDGRLTDLHPWSLAARINLGNIYLSQERFPDAARIFREGHEGALEVLPTGHPYLAALGNNVMRIDAWLAAGSRGQPPSDLSDVDVHIPVT